jgi:hypothetical protein
MMSLYQLFKKNLDRMEETLQKLSLLREYEEEAYSHWDMLLKIS